MHCGYVDYFFTVATTHLSRKSSGNSCGKNLVKGG